MIASTKKLEKYCIDYKNIENYEEAVKSPLKYDLHHRLEIDEMQSAKDLIFLHLYYHRPPEELIFLEHGEHQRLHKANLSAETRQKISDAKKGDKNPMFGKHPSAESRQKISEAHKGNQNALGHHWNMSAETRKRMSEAHKGEKCYMFGKSKSTEWKKKMSEAHKGRHWHLENGKRIYTD